MIDLNTLAQIVVVAIIIISGAVAIIFKGLEKKAQLDKKLKKIKKEAVK